MIKEGTILEIEFHEKWFAKDDMLQTGDGRQAQVIETPYKKWYLQLLELISFGFYKAPYQYRIKILDEIKPEQ